jgi:hypothetical protein
VAKFSLNGRPWTNNFWFVKLAFDDSDLNALAVLADASWGAGIKAIISDQGGYGSCQAYDMRSILGGVQTSIVNAGNGGHSTSDAISIATSIVLTLRTGQRGRSGRGRVYVAGLAEDQWSSGQFTSTPVGAVETAYGTMRTAAIAAGWTPVICSHQNNGVVLTVPQTYPVTTWTVRSNIEGHQRRRTGRP